MLDVGSQNFYYAATLVAVFCPRKRLGIDIVSIQMDIVGMTMPLYYRSFGPHTVSCPMDFSGFLEK